MHELVDIFEDDYDSWVWIAFTNEGRLWIAHQATGVAFDEKLERIL